MFVIGFPSNATSPDDAVTIPHNVFRSLSSGAVRTDKATISPR